MSPSNPAPSRSDARSAARGQTLVLFGLGIFLLALMVMMTLAITTRIKERMEVQTLADAAAYSNAVASARAMNALALANRAMIGELVAKAGTHALISWSAAYYAGANQEKIDFELILMEWQSNRCSINPITDPVAFARWGVFIPCYCAIIPLLTAILEPRMISELASLAIKTNVGETAALWAMQGRDLAREGTFYAQQVAIFQNGLIDDKLNNQDLAKRVVAQADVGSRWPGELDAPSGGDWVSKEEASGGFQCLSGGAVCWQNPAAPFHYAEATMGTIGWPFVINRFDMVLGPWSLMQAKLRKNGRHLFPGEFLLPPMELVPPLPWSISPVPFIMLTGVFVDVEDYEGGTYWGFIQHPSWYIPIVPTQLISDDNYAFETKINPTLVLALYTLWTGGSPPPSLCDWNPLSTTDSAGGAAESRINSYNISFAPASRHRISYRSHLRPPHPPDPLHFGEGMPGLFAMPWYFDYNLASVTDGDNNFGQPKNMAVVTRDYSLRRPGNQDPFGMTYFYQQGTAPGQELILDGTALNDGTNIARQTAVGTGIAYYHRRNAYKEPPNLLNPYWRATLVASDTDERRGEGGTYDAEELMSGGRANRPDAEQTIQRLRAAGYKGWH